MISAVDLRCEYLHNPIGIDQTRPRLTWRLSSEGNAAQQVAFEVAGQRDSATAASFDTGRIQGPRQSICLDEIHEWRSGERWIWTVTVWDQDDNASQSEQAWFEFGLLEPNDWRARWIGIERPAGQRNGFRPSPYLRKVFEAGAGIERARLYVTALGLYRSFINGHRVASDEFTPGWTDYSKRVQYQTYDVTDLLREGTNTIGLVLGDGWYSGYLGTDFKRERYGDTPMALAQLVIDHGGRVTHVTTDETWRGSFGAIVASDIYLGETQDMRLEPQGWLTDDFDDSDWAAATASNPTPGPLVWSPSPRVHRIGEIEPVDVRQPRLGHLIFDMGQNFAGRLSIQADVQGDRDIKVRHAEALGAGDSSLYVDNLRHADATDRFIASGKEAYEPWFTYHGFRFAEITGFEPEASPPDVKGMVLGTDVAVAGDFTCSDDSLNLLHDAIVRSFRSNWFEVPTDCPNRDERLGWTGDAIICARTGCYLLDAAPFYRKWLIDVDDALTDDGLYTDVAPAVPPWTSMGAPGWGDGAIVTAWTLYEFYGDERFLSDHFDSMKRWIDHVRDSNPDLVWRNDRGKDYGDWLAVEADTDKTLLATAIWARSTRLVGKAAAVLGLSVSAELLELADQIARTFRSQFVRDDSTLTSPTQTAYALALRYDLLTQDQRAIAIDHLVADIASRDHRLSTGFLGTEQLLPALVDGGRSDVAYRLLLSDRFPSWLYFIRNGATTMWEHWDSWTAEDGFKNPFMNSFNHCSLGSVGAFLYGYVLGIRPDENRPGGKHFFISPTVGDELEHASGSYMSVRGKVAVSWRHARDGLDLDVTVPTNSFATIEVPHRRGQSIEAEGVENHREPGVYAVSGGSYRFTVR